MNSFVVEWIRQNTAFNTVATETAYSLINDASGNIYFSYSTNGITSANTKIGQFDIVVCKMDPSGNVLWSHQNNILNTIAREDSPALACDTFGHVYVAYITTGTISGQVRIGTFDIVLCKMDSTTGSVEWVHQDSVLNTQLWDFIPRITTDISGNIYMLYMTEGSTSGNSNATSPFYDIVVCKVNSAGTVLWTRQNIALNTIEYEISDSITTDTSGNIYISYTTAGSTSGNNLTGILDIVVCKLDPSGNILWSRQNNGLNTNMIDSNVNLMCDAFGHVYLVYMTSGTISGQSHIGDYDIVVCKMNAENGEILWVYQDSSLNTPNDDMFPYVSVDASGSIYILYYTNGTYGGSSLYTGGNIALCKLDPTGALVGSVQNIWTNTNTDNVIMSISMDVSQNIYVIYSTTGSTSGNTNTGDYDVVVVKLRQEIITTANNFPVLLQDYITLGPTLVFTPEYVTALRDGKPLPSTALVDWIPPTGLPARTPLRDLKKSIVTMQKRLHTYRFRYMQEIFGPTTEGVDPLRCGYVCTWAASGQAYLP